MDRVFEKLFETPEFIDDDGFSLKISRSSEPWVYAVTETNDSMRRDFARESPSVFFEGAVIAIPLASFLWLVIYFAIRAIFF